MGEREDMGASLQDRAGHEPSRDASRPFGDHPSRESLGAYVGLTSAENAKYPNTADVADGSFTFLPINKPINVDDLRPRGDSGLVEHAVRIARPRYQKSAPRWSAVMDTFAVGRTAAIELCVRFGFDPEEKRVRR